MKLDTRLTDEAMAELLGASEGAASKDAELSQVRTALDSYRAETLLWAERRSATQPSLAARARRDSSVATLSRWSLASAALLMVCGGAFFVNSHSADRDGASVAVSAAPQSDIAADNRLLLTIDDALTDRSSALMESFEQTPADADAKRNERSGETD